MTPEFFFFFPFSVYLTRVYLHFKAPALCHNSTPEAWAWKRGFRATDWTQRFIRNRQAERQRDKWLHSAVSSSPLSIPPLKGGWNMFAFRTSAWTEALMEVCGSLFHLCCLQNVMRPSRKRKENRECTTNTQTTPLLRFHFKIEFHPFHCTCQTKGIKPSGSCW